MGGSDARVHDFTCWSLSGNRFPILGLKLTYGHIALFGGCSSLTYLIRLFEIPVNLIPSNARRNPCSRSRRSRIVEDFWDPRRRCGA